MFAPPRGLSAQVGVDPDIPDDQRRDLGREVSLEWWWLDLLWEKVARLVRKWRILWPRYQVSRAVCSSYCDFSGPSSPIATDMVGKFLLVLGVGWCHLYPFVVGPC